MKLTAESVFTETDQLCLETLEMVGTRPKAATLAYFATVCSALYGVTMGMNHSPLQALVSACKVPMLFLATLCITLPTLHFIGLLFGSRIKLSQSLIVLLTGIAVTSILLAAFAPISLLFLASGSSYPFLVLMHVATFAFCGGAGLYTVYRSFAFIRSQSPKEEGNPISNHVLKIWMLLYMFVGTQTAFVLAPFINPEPYFEWFGKPKGNFYTYVWSMIIDMFK